MSRNVTAVKDVFIGEEFKSRINGNTVATKVKYGQRAYLSDWDSSHYNSWYA